MYWLIREMKVRYFIGAAHAAKGMERSPSAISMTRNQSSGDLNGEHQKVSKIMSLYVPIQII